MKKRKGSNSKTELIDSEQQASMGSIARKPDTSQDVGLPFKGTFDVSAADVALLIENAPDAIFRVDSDLRHTFVNSAMERFTGLTRGKLLGSRLEDWIFLPEEIRNQMRNAGQEVFETGLSLDLHVAYPMGGGTRYFETRLVPERDPHGQITAVIGIARDITETREKERELVVERAFREAVENSVTVCVAVMDTEGRQIHVNRGFCRMVGWDAKELLGKEPPFLYWPEGEREYITLQYREILEGKAPVGFIETRFQRQKGDIFDALVVFSELLDGAGKRIGWVGSVNDISEQKRRENDIRRLNRELEQRVLERTAELDARNRELESVVGELRRVKGKLESARDKALRQKDYVESILDTVPAGVALMDIHGSLAYCNNAALELWGKAPTEKTGTFDYVQELRLSDADGRPFDPFELPSSRALFKGEEVRGEEVMIKHPDGSELTVLTNATPLQGPDGLSGAALAFMNITAIKRAQKLSQALSAINLQLLAGVDHEVNIQYALTEGANSLQADTAVLSLLANGSEWVVRKVYGFSDDLIGTTMNNRDVPYVALAVQKGQPVVIADTLDKEWGNSTHLREHGVRSVIVVPILGKRVPLG